MRNEERAANLLHKLAKYPAIHTLARAQLNNWPNHVKALETALADSDPEFSQRTNELARLVLRLTGDKLDAYCDDYQWMCKRFLEEQVHFQRHGTYRLRTFAEAYAEVYSQRAYMDRYVNGILMSQVFWRNHALAIDLFRTDFLSKNSPGFRHLDIGPGHGLFLAYAAQEPKCGGCTGWDVSPASIDTTRQALDRLGLARPVALELHDVVKPWLGTRQFESAVISEVLEHLETPERALAVLHQVLVPGGRVFINVPVNSPAPDHIYLWTHPDEVMALIVGAGFDIEATHLIPASGQSLAAAITEKLDISCIVVARA